MLYKILFSVAALLLTLIGFLEYEHKQVPVQGTTEKQLAPQNASGAVEKVLDTASQRQIEIYQGISVSENVTEIDLSNKGLTGSLKAEIRQVTQLSSLNLEGNKFTGLPAEVGQLHELTVLNLSNNAFTGLPHELGGLSKLKVLDLRGNAVSPTDLAVLKNSLPKTTSILKD